jgi:AP-1-like transcription factor
VRDLEAKLNLLTTTTSSLQSDNERLKLMLQRAQTENEILRATASSSPTANHPPGFVDDPSLLPSSRTSKTSPSRVEEPHFDSTRLANGLLSTESTPNKSRQLPNNESNLLSASATWDLLQSHPLYLSGAVDIGEVCERLKKMARCDGMGPMFEEAEVRKVIEEVGRSGGDELI